MAGFEIRKSEHVVSDSEKDKKYIFFESVKDFCEQCFNDYSSLEAALCDLFHKQAAYETAWRASLMQMAYLLDDPFKGWKKIKEEVNEQCDSAEELAKRIKNNKSGDKTLKYELLEELISPKFLAFITSADRVEILNLLEPYMNSMPDLITKRSGATKDRMKKAGLKDFDFEGVSVMLEYPIKTEKRPGKASRVDMILRKDERWVLLEFKGWSEWYVGEDSGDPRKQLRNYMKWLDEPGRELFGIVYMHNQIFDEGELSKGVVFGLQPYLYTKHCSDQFIKKVHDFLFNGADV